MDSDGLLNADDIPRFLTLLGWHGRVMEYGPPRHDSLLGRQISVGYSRCARATVGSTCRDANGAFKLLRTTATSVFPLRAQEFLARVEEIFARCQACGFPSAESGVTHLPRRAGTSTVHPRHLLETLQKLIRLRGNLRRRRRP